MRRLAIISVIGLGLAACSHESAANGDSGVRGQVLAGPQCPVEIAGSPCPDQPVDAQIRVTNSAGDEVQTVDTDEDGRFEIALDPGRYTLEPTAPGSGPFPAGWPTDVMVRADAFTRVTLQMDTGIR